jgi:co-chaperonin GroES (HSP10)|tara:strand:- start:43 stop:300 length:258 start_codon:yes stop_codon:yes gene_type:complete
MKAINYYVVIEKIKEKPKSDSGFVLTETQNEDIRYLKGRVISVGDLVNGITEGNIVHYDKHAGHGIEFDNKYYFVIKHADIVIIE